MKQDLNKHNQHHNNAGDTCRHCTHVEPDNITDLSNGYLIREIKDGVHMLTNGN